MEFALSVSTRFRLRVIFICKDHELCHHQMGFPITRIKETFAMFLLSREKSKKPLRIYRIIPQKTLEYKILKK